MKILTLNIWRYYDWDKRKEKAIKYLKEQDADIVFLQEVAYDDRLKDKYENQPQEINLELEYNSYAYGKLMDMSKWHREPIDWKMDFGLGILSRYPIKKSEVIILPKVNIYKDFGFFHIVLDTPKGDLNIINVHFENTDEGSRDHLKKTLDWCKRKKIFPIIAGDFNMKNTDNLIQLADENYHISYKLNPYKSFAPTAFSNNDEPITLDYIIAHKNKFQMSGVECIQNDVSDHNPVKADISFQ